MDTLNIKAEEFACKCCGKKKPSQELHHIMQMIRTHFGKPVIITSGYRCETNNRKCGGAPKSKHLLGIACDFKVKGVDEVEVYHFLNSTFPESLGLGLYDRASGGWVHLDVREDKARWIG